MLALSYLLNAFQEAPTKSLRWLPTLRAGAIAVWMLNATIFRPGEQEWDLILMKKCAFQDSNPSGRTSPAFYSLGAYFVSDIRYDGGVYRLSRLSGGDELSLEEIKLVFNLTYYQLESSIVSQANTQKSRRVVKGIKAPQRGRRIRRAAALVDIPDEQLRVDFHLSESGVTSHRILDMTGDDEHEAEEGDARIDIDARLTWIWHTLFADIIDCIPLPKNKQGPLYCTLNVEGRESASSALFEQPNLPFTCAQLKMANVCTWDELFFDRFFPEKASLVHERRANLQQHFPQCQYFMMWEVILTDTPYKYQGIIREKLLQEWRKLLWLPYSASDRMWITRKVSGAFKQLGASGGAAPQIAVNERLAVDLQEFCLV